MRKLATLTLLACLGIGCDQHTAVGTEMIVMPATASQTAVQEVTVLSSPSETRCWTLGRSVKDMWCGTHLSL